LRDAGRAGRQTPEAAQQSILQRPGLSAIFDTNYKKGRTARSRALDGPGRQAIIARRAGVEPAISCETAGTRATRLQAAQSIGESGLSHVVPFEAEASKSTYPRRQLMGYRQPITSPRSRTHGNIVYRAFGGGAKQELGILSRSGALRQDHHSISVFPFRRLDQPKVKASFRIGFHIVGGPSILWAHLKTELPRDFAPRL
jgi:hypothetical protein